MKIYLKSDIDALDVTFIDALSAFSQLPEGKASDADIGGENMGNVSDRDEHDAVMLPLDHTWFVF